MKTYFEKVKLNLEAHNKTEYTTRELIRHVMDWLDNEEEWIMDDFKCPEVLFEYFHLVSVEYDVSLMSEVIECLEEGDSPQAYNDFIKKHGVNWCMYLDGEFVEPV